MAGVILRQYRVDNLLELVATLLTNQRVVVLLVEHLVLGQQLEDVLWVILAMVRRQLASL